MAFNPLNSKDVTIGVGSVTYAFKVAKVAMKNKLGDVTNFKSAGARQFIAGPFDAKITLTGPYDQGNMPFTLGNSYTLIVTYTTAVTLTITCLLESIDDDIDLENPQQVSLVFQSNGTFTAAIT